jgi:hypothetical protein
MTVEWITGNDTITVIYEFLPYQQPIANRADVAKSILFTYTEMVERGRISEYGLQLPTFEEKNSICCTLHRLAGDDSRRRYRRRHGFGLEESAHEPIDQLAKLGKV